MAGSVTRDALTVTLTVHVMGYIESSVYHVVEKAELTAEFGCGPAHHGDVLADEFADHSGERRNGPAGADHARHPACAAAVTDGVEQLLLVDAEAAGQSHGLPQQADLRGEQRVVDQLDAVTRADLADVQNRIAVAGQQGPDPLDGVVGAADEQ